MIPHSKVSVKSAGRGVAWKVVAFVAVFAIMASLAVLREGRLFGHSFAAEKETPGIVRKGDSYVINTSDAGKGFTGYAGPVPVEIYVTGGRIDSVRPLPNSETPGFFARLEEEGLVLAWDGKTLREAASMRMDAVSGATYSSDAFIGNVRAGVALALESDVSDSVDTATAPGKAWKLAIVLTVILCGAVVPLFVHNKRYRIVQEILNVGVLGFWAGCFIDYAMMLKFFSSTPVFTLASVITVALLVVGLIFPLFGKSNWYCAWICPFGSLQELAGRLTPSKMRIGRKWMRFLDGFRQALWVVLMLLLYAGWGAGWIDYEIFSGFVVESASWIVLAAGGLFIVLSLFINRPFCRFVCPTGTLLKQL